MHRHKQTLNITKLVIFNARRGSEIVWMRKLYEAPAATIQYNNKPLMINR